ncbi:hypothetical protein BT69DRAFT_1306667 [Atractiella rhizophila]|nr:hypothetical protein BT69DRAFT_1306667 [Atractiella rhizophila]
MPFITPDFSIEWKRELGFLPRTDYRPLLIRQPNRSGYDLVPNTKRSELLLNSTVLSHDPKPNPPPPSSQAAILVPKTWSELKGIRKKTALLLILLEIMGGDTIPQAFVKKTKKIGESHDYIALWNQEPPSFPMPSYEELMGCDDAHWKDFIDKVNIITTTCN